MSPTPACRRTHRRGRGGGRAGGALPDPGALVFPPIVWTSLLLVAFVLSVYKPCGRVRRGP